MRILLLTHAFNSLTQRLAAELRQRKHEISIRATTLPAIISAARDRWRWTCA